MLTLAAQSKLSLLYCSVEEVKGDGVELVILSSTRYVYSKEEINYFTRPKATSLTVNNTSTYKYLTSWP